MSVNKTPFIEISDLVKKFGTFTALNVIETNNLNPNISSFFYCILLFYLFFEVFFSFFRKLMQKKSWMKQVFQQLKELII